MKPYHELYKPGDKILIVADAYCIYNDVLADTISDRLEITIIGISPDKILLLGDKTKLSHSMWHKNLYPDDDISGKIPDFDSYEYRYYAIPGDVVIIGKVPVASISYGASCKNCLEYFPYAEVTNNTFICYGCRNGIASLFKRN